MAESHGDEAQTLPTEPVDAGTQLRQAREALGLGRADIAAKTKIPERHIASMEAGEFTSLAGRSYALGFSRTYARAVGLDEQALLAAVRLELGDAPAEPEHRNAFEPGDPSRIPSKRVAWLAALVAIAAAIGMLFFWRGRSDTADETDDLGLSVEETPGALATGDPALVPSVEPTDALTAATGGAALGDPAIPAPAVPRAPVRLGEPVSPSPPAFALPTEAEPPASEATPAAPSSTVPE